MIDNIIFDLDGTLIDSSEDILASLEKAYLICGYEYDKERFNKLFIGPPLPEMIRHLSPSLGEEKSLNIINTFRMNYEKSGYTKTSPYNGVEKALRGWRNNGKKLFLATNKPLRLSAGILHKVNLSDVFLDMVSPDTPDFGGGDKTVMINYLVKKWHINPTLTLVVGDSASDLRAAKKNGMYSAGVLYGYGYENEIRGSKPDYTIKKFEELTEIVN